MLHRKKRVDHCRLQNNEHTGQRSEGCCEFIPYAAANLRGCIAKTVRIAGERDLGISVECGRGVPRESGTGIKKLAAALTQTVDYTGSFL